MQDYTVKLFLEYIYNRFALVFFICLLGSFVKDWQSTMKTLSKFDIKRIIISSLSASMVVSAITEYIHFKFSVYIFICFLSGLWGYKILECITNWDFVKNFLYIIGNVFKSDLTDIIIEATKDIEHENEMEKNNEKEKSKNKEDSG